MATLRNIYLRQIKELEQNVDRVMAIHYSCESFYDIKKGSTTIVTIAIKGLVSGQVTTFSLCNYVEEAKMLKDYFEFLKANKDKLFIHWNMHHPGYGFAALENRYIQLTGKEPFRLRDEQKYDLDHLVETKYGPDYVDHHKLQNLAIGNGYSMIGFKTGPEEAELFKQGEHFDNQQSTISKVGIIARILEDMLSNRLRTKETRFRRNVRLLVAHPLTKIIGVLGAVASIVALALWLLWR